MAVYLKSEPMGGKLKTGCVKLHKFVVGDILSVGAVAFYETFFSCQLFRVLVLIYLI